MTLPWETWPLTATLRGRGRGDVAEGAWQGGVAGGRGGGCSAAHCADTPSRPPSLICAPWDLGLTLRGGCCLPLPTPCPLPATQVQGAGSGLGGDFWAGSQGLQGRAASPFPERGRKAQHLGTKPPSPPSLWPEASPCDLASGRGASSGGGVGPLGTPREDICPLCFRGQPCGVPGPVSFVPTFPGPA